MNKQLVTSYKKHADTTTLNPQNIELLKAARAALSKSYAPYSKFYVSAAVRTAKGIYIGANQENASYPLCMCAERVALYNYAMQDIDGPALSLAIIVHNPEQPVLFPATPCGACRQVILEYELRQKQDINILLQADTDEVWEFKSIKSILPLHFDPEVL